jgi:hypothetical protein
MILLTARLMRGAEITVEYVQQAHGVSLATAKRDVAMLLHTLPVNVGRGLCRERILRRKE